MRALDFGSDSLRAQLGVLGNSLRDSRIVLLGENGHGVGEFSSAKAELVRWLYEEHGFDVVAFESGFFECSHVWNRIHQLEPPDALLECLKYPLQHAELVPLFEYIRSTAGSPSPLVLAGIDIQEQGFDSEIRPSALHAVLDTIDPELADRVAVLDTLLFLPARSGGLDEEVYDWVLEHGQDARKTYEAAAALTSGWERWTFLLATGWIDRLTVRAESEAAGSTERPARYYEIRDEWMARAITALADSIDGERKVIVYLHNDHARYGLIDNGRHTNRSAGNYLRAHYGPDVYSVGFFMGRGSITDNSRNERPVSPADSLGIESFLGSVGAPASYLVIRENTSDSIRAWASGTRPYLRMGTQPTTLVPADEFDALVYVDSVGAPDYKIP